MTNQEALERINNGTWNANNMCACLVLNNCRKALKTVDKIPELIEKLEEKYSNFCGFDLSTCTKYGNETAEQQEKSYSTMMMYEIADEVEEIIDIVKHILETE